MIDRIVSSLCKVKRALILSCSQEVRQWTLTPLSWVQFPPAQPKIKNIGVIFLLGFVIGLVVGACIGIVITSLLVASKDSDDMYKEDKKWQD